VPKFHLVLVIHAHQPVGNFEEVFERSYNSCYRPFLDVLDRHPRIRLGLHFSGPLLQWLERAHPEYFDHLRELCRRGQVEVIGGGFYEPILIAIPPRDRLEQIKRLADYIEKHFGAPPRGAWLTERVNFLAPDALDRYFEFSRSNVIRCVGLRLHRLRDCN
jgi:alpha-amylase/alpha-mannosidase (GH57 family)